MEQKYPADIFKDALDYLWNGLGLDKKGWKRLKKGDFKKRAKNGLSCRAWYLIANPRKLTDEIVC